MKNSASELGLIPHVLERKNPVVGCKKPCLLLDVETAARTTKVSRDQIISSQSGLLADS